MAGGLVAGALDIAYAWVFWAVKASVPAERILQSIAAGLLGRASFAGGMRTALLGFVLHFSIAVTMSAVYYLVATRWALLWRKPWLCGAAYGAVLYVVMNYVVVPLSASPPPSTDPLWIVLSVFAHMLLVGIPCAFFARAAIRS